jgi:YD repeat-containing protein
MPRPSCWLTLLLLGLTLSSAVMAQAPPPPPGGGGTPEIKAVSHVATAVVNVEYFLDDDYPGFGGAPELLLFSGGLEMERFEVSGTAGTHDYDVELPVPDGTFVVRIHLDNLAGQPWGISRTFTVKDGVVTLLLSAEYIGTTGIPSTVPVYVCKECARGTFAPQGDSALDTLIPSSLTAIDFGANGGVGACSSCAGGSLPDGSAFTSIQLMPQVFLSRSSFSPGYFSEFDTSIHVFRSDIDGLGAYYTDPSTGQVITFFDQINGSSADGLLEDEHGKYLEARVEESGGGLTTDLTQATKIVLKRRDGLIETFELFDPTDSDAESDKDGKLVSRKDANGNEVVITYGSGWELSQITLPNGHVYQYAYGAQQSGRDTVSGMTLPNGTSVSFSYTDGFLSGVTAGTWQWNCSITQDAIAQTTNYNITSSSGNQTFYLTKDFIELDGSLLNQPVNFLRAIANGNGENVMSLFVNPSDTNQVLVWRGEDSLLLRTLGVSEVHYTSWSVGDPSQGWNAFTNKIPESTYAANGIFQSTRAKLLGSPEDSVDETGVSTVHEYDSDFFLTKRTYSDGTYEEWTYDADHHVTRRRDRAGRVTKFVYDSAGNMTESHRGILDVNGTDVNQPEYAVYRYEYSAAGLITKEKGPLYSAAQPDLQITEYVYGANDRLVEKREAADVSGGARPTTYYTYDAAGRLQTTTDPAGRVTSFTYDNLNRLIQTVYPDNSTEQTLYGAASSGQEGLVVKTKNRRGVVTTYGYDSSARPTWKLAGAATDSNILDGQPDDNPITDLSLQIHTSYQYLPGTSLPETVTVNSQTTSHTYDYRRRQATVTRYPRSGSSLTTSYTFENNRLFSIEDPYGRKEFRGYRVADGVLLGDALLSQGYYSDALGSSAANNRTLGLGISVGVQGGLAAAPFVFRGGVLLRQLGGTNEVVDLQQISKQYDSLIKKGDLESADALLKKFGLAPRIGTLAPAEGGLIRASSWTEFQQRTKGWFTKNTSFFSKRNPAADASQGYHWYKHARSTTDIPLLGTLPAVRGFLRRKTTTGFYRLNARPWQLQVNDSWLAGHIESGSRFRVISDMADPNNLTTTLRKSGEVVESVFARELRILQEVHGYRYVPDSSGLGGWLVPPGT